MLEAFTQQQRNRVHHTRWVAASALLHVLVVVGVWRAILASQHLHRQDEPQHVRLTYYSPPPPPPPAGGGAEHKSEPKVIKKREIIPRKVVKPEIVQPREPDPEPEQN